MISERCEMGALYQCYELIGYPPNWQTGCLIPIYSVESGTMGSKTMVGHVTEQAKNTIKVQV